MFSPTVRKAINYRVTQAQAFERAALLHASLIAADEETNLAFDNDTREPPRNKVATPDRLQMPRPVDYNARGEDWQHSADVDTSLKHTRPLKDIPGLSP